VPPPPKPPEAHRRAAAPAWFSPSRAWAFAWREGLELIRDPIRLAFALLGPVALMLAMGFAISFDVENLAFATLDQDQSPESRMLKQEFAASRYFDEGPPLRSFTDLDARMRQGDIALALVIPPDFGRDLLAGHRPEIAAWLDGSVTARAETARGYVQGVYVQGVYAAWLKELSHTETGHVPRSIAAFEPRFRYNQAFRSANAIPPGGVMMMLIMIPAMLTALGVVREKELGSICNLYAAPARKFEFLLGKQAPYGAVAMVSFVILTGVMRAAFGLSPVGSVTALVIGAALYTTAATAFGLVISCFVRSQIAAVFASAIIVMVPTVNFSGMLYPVATLTGGAKLFGQSFPPLYFQRISAGVYNKGLSLVDLAPDMAMLALFCAAFWALATMLLSKQEA
jgi:ribosome-dependent ATPase